MNTHTLNRGMREGIIHRRYNLIDSNESEIVVVEIRVQIRGCSKIVGWNPPSPSIKMSQRVSCKWQILRGERERKRKINSRGRISWFTRSFATKFISSGRILELRRERERYIYIHAPIFLFGHIISIRFISFYYYSKVVDE